MQVERGFFLSFYLTLALAGACLGVVVMGSHPSEVAILAGPVAGILVLAYLLEGRWSLSIFWSTMVGLLMAAGAGLWFASFAVQLSMHETDAVSWLVLLLPHMGFWLVLLMLGATFVLAFSSVLFKFFAVRDDYWSTIFWNFAGEALFGAGILVMPRYRKQFAALFKKHPGPVIGVNAANELINLGGGLGVRSERRPKRCVFARSSWAFRAANSARSSCPVPSSSATRVRSWAFSAWSPRTRAWSVGTSVGRGESASMPKCASGSACAPAERYDPGREYRANRLAEG